MILCKNVSISAGEIEEGLIAARSILDSKWLEIQHRLEPSDPLLFYIKPTVTPRFAIHGIRHRLENEMHPIAEAVLVGQAVIEQYKKDKRICGSNLIYLLISIRDIVKEKDRIPNIEEQIFRLQGRDWKAVLYELLTAVSYIDGTRVQFILEANSPTPDLELLRKPPIYVECKAKLQYETDISNFIGKWRREALGNIAAFLSKVDGGFLVKIRLKGEAVIPKVPMIIKEMVTTGQENRIVPEGQIDIVPFESNEVSPSVPMSFMSEDFWEWALGFKEWKDWHYILPGGDVQFSNRSNMIVKKIKRPVLICVRAENLVDNTQKILPTLKNTCKRQFKSYKPGIIHILINTNLFGLGEKSNINYIQQCLNKSAKEIFRNYSRIWKIVYDIVTPPALGKHLGSVKRITLKNRRCMTYPKTFKEPLSVILW